MTIRLAIGLVAAVAIVFALFAAQGSDTEAFGATPERVAAARTAPGLRARDRPRQPAQRRGFGGGFGRQEVKLVERFDANGDGWLNAEERLAARQAMGIPLRGRRPGSAAPSGLSLAPAEVRQHPESSPVYDLDTLRTIFLQFDRDDWEQELAAFYNTDVEVPATMVVDGETFDHVGVHFRGNSSYRQVPEGYKRSLNLSLDYVHDKQDLGGYQTFNLLNSNNDATFVRTILYTEVARHYIPMPAANYLRVVINGESWGIYVSAQQFNSDFTREWFGTRDGVRWKVPGSPRTRAGLEYLGEGVGPYRRLYEIKTDEDPEAWADLIELSRVLNETPPERLEEALSPRLDIDGALKFLALEVVMVNSDGYWTRSSDYNLYQDVEGQFHIVPHDVNEALEGEGRRGGFGARGGVRLDPLVALNDSTKPLRSKLLAVPALRARYMEYVRDIAERWLDWSVLEPLVRRSQALIAEDVRTDGRKLDSFDAFESDVEGLQRFVEQRRSFLLGTDTERSAE